MKRTQLIRDVKKLGWFFDDGTKHDKMSHPKAKHKLIIPRHIEINENVARSILKSANKLN